MVSYGHKSFKIAKMMEEGYRFSCQMCGDCCRGFQDGEVFLYEKDIKRLAPHLGYNGKDGLKEFCLKYLKIISDSFYWKEPGEERGKNYRFKALGFKFTGNDEHCEFLSNDNKCTVHEYRPFQCRSFPFWQMMVSSRKNILEYSNKCPGLQKERGKYYGKEEILEWARKEYEIEKEFFLKMRENDFDLFKTYDFLPKELKHK